MVQDTAIIASLAGELLLLGERLSRAEVPEFGTMRRRILEGIARMDGRAEAAGLTPQEAQDLRYAIAAYLDERIQYSDLPLRLEWRARPLQAELFEETLAGERFFERMGNAAARKSQRSIAVFLLALLMGFRGKYRGREQELQRLFNEARFHVARETTTLSPQALEPVAKTPPLRRLPFAWAGLALVGLSILVLVVLWVMLGSRLDEASTMLRALSTL